MLRLFAESGQTPTQREKREYVVGNAGIYVKTADNEHLRGPAVFWGAIRPSVNSDFGLRNAAEGNCGAWLFVSPAEEAGLGQCWLVPAGTIEAMLDQWEARAGATQAQLTLHIRGTSGGGFQLRGGGASIDVTRYHLRFPVAAQ